VTGAGSEAIDPEACTAVLLSVPRPVAERIESFLRANGIACRTRPNTEMTPERLAEEYLEQSPGASRLQQLPFVGEAVRTQIGERLQGIEIDASEILPVWDVLVRPEDLPEVSADAQSADPVDATPPRLNVPVEAASAEDPGLGEQADAPAVPGSPVVLCELPWSEAWNLTQRLIQAGIPAAVLAAEDPDRDRPMSQRIVPVGVREEDLERARMIDA
jgi:hypothetical protein